MVFSFRDTGPARMSYCIFNVDIPGYPRNNISEKRTADLRKNSLNNVFCFKPTSKNNNTKKETFDDIHVMFSPNISSALEISYNEYVIIYAEENKYSKRKIIEVLYDNIKVDEKKKTEVLNNHHPIIYFLIVLLKYDESKQTKSYKLMNKYFEENNIRTSDEDNSIDGKIKENKINEINEKLGNINIDGNDNSKNKRIKTDIINNSFIYTFLYNWYSGSKLRYQSDLYVFD
ncbi:hypothetical protein H8356DRAFT_1341536 [Neocallimastix lanati (nom. inval.)]|nr:hypothetical protein H8356DRAFT_1341536 [Neocallimastix sp. JGI-2020a]